MITKSYVPQLSAKDYSKLISSMLSFLQSYELKSIDFKMVTLQDCIWNAPLCNWTMDRCEGFLKTKNVLVCSKSIVYRILQLYEREKGRERD